MKQLSQLRNENNWNCPTSAPVDTVTVGVVTIGGDIVGVAAADVVAVGVVAADVVAVGADTADVVAVGVGDVAAAAENDWKLLDLKETKINNSWINFHRGKSFWKKLLWHQLPIKTGKLMYSQTISV